MTSKQPGSKETQPTRVRVLLEGLGILTGSVVGGIALLGLIGLIPGHQESRPLEPVLSVVSLAMMAGTIWGLWLIIKGLLGFK